MSWSPQQKHAAVVRELGYRRRVYPRWVETGRMPKAKADEQIAIFEAIAEDYKRQVDAEQAKADFFGGAA